MTDGERIRKRRKELGLTQKELGKRLGVSASMIAQYEANLRKPKSETKEKIAEALSATWDFMLGLTDSPDTRLATQADMDHFGEKEPPNGWGLTQEERTMLEKFKHLPLDERNLISAIVDYCFERFIKKANKK